MLHKEFWGLLFIGFVVWVFVAGTPSQRIENFCRPIGWSGNAVVSLSALALPAQEANAQKWFDKFEYGCRYLTWRLFYQDAYNKWLAEQNAAPGAASAPSVAAPAASSVATPVAPPASSAAAK